MQSDFELPQLAVKLLEREQLVVADWWRGGRTYCLIVPYFDSVNQTLLEIFANVLFSFGTTDHSKSNFQTAIIYHPKECLRMLQ